MKPGPKLGSKQAFKPKPTHSFSPTLKQVEFVRLRIIESLESCGYGIVRLANAATTWDPLDEIIRVETELARYDEYWMAVGDTAIQFKLDQKGEEIEH
jgi:hypothetical protein